MKHFLTFNASSQSKMSIVDRLKMINQKLYIPLPLYKEKREKVKSYFKKFFIEVDKLSSMQNPPNRKQR